MAWVQASISLYTRLYIEILKLRFYLVKDCKILIFDSLVEELELTLLNVEYLKKHNALEGREHLYIDDNEMCGNMFCFLWNAVIRELHGYVLVICACALGLICVKHNELKKKIKSFFCLHRYSTKHLHPIRQTIHKKSS